MNSTKERNYNVDFLRGIAALCIILIHTAWWLGESYTPLAFRNLCLFIDVPVFIYLAGYSFNYSGSIIKNIKGFLMQWFKWIVFLVFYFLIMFLFFRNDLHINEILYWLAFKFPTPQPFPIVNGSMWFMYMYLKVSFVGSIIIVLLKKYASASYIESYLTCVFFCLILFIISSTVGNILFFDSQLAFYLLIYLIGYLSNDYKVKNFKQFLLYEIILLLITIVVFKVYGINITNIQNIKWSLQIPYLFFALHSIILFWYLKDVLKIKGGNIINYVGKNAIYFYFSQGVACSLSYFIIKYYSDYCFPLKFLTTLIFNIVVTVIVAIILVNSYNLLSKLLRKINLSFLVPSKQ
ncbi:MAG: acyltransferase family protein [Candidatus Dojkabacteria bacterium]